MRLPFAMALAGLLATASWSLADDTPNDLFSRLDADKDGKVTREEAGEEHARLFDRLLRTADKDEDKALSRQEFEAGTTPRPAERTAIGGDRRPGAGGQRLRGLMQLDKNKDGFLSRDEAPEQMKAAFDRLDANKDGKLEAAELQRAPNAAAGGGEFFARLDSNKDGKISLDEVPEPRQPFVKQLLAKLGGDKTSLTKEEFQKAMLALRQRETDQARPSDRGLRIGALMKTLDQDSDGQLSAQEVEQAAAALKKLDRDGDGALSQRELFAAARELAGPDARPGARSGARPDARPGARPGARRPGARPNDRPDAKPAANPNRRPDAKPGARPGRPGAGRLQELDKDGDKQISREEAPERLRERFDQIDKNKDGKLSPEELQAAARRRPQ